MIVVSLVSGSSTSCLIMEGEGREGEKREGEGGEGRGRRQGRHVISSFISEVYLFYP